MAALADGLLITQSVLASQRVVLGGGLASAGAALLDPLAAALRERATVQVVPELRTAELGERAGVVGVGLAARAALIWHRRQALISACCAGDSPVHLLHRRR